MPERAALVVKRFGNQRATDRAMAASNLTLVTRQQVQTGLVVRDTRGQRIGTVSRIDANSAVVVSGNRQYHVPLKLYFNNGNFNGNRRRNLRI